jgi:probable HAF family extracellular repeat protein
MLMTLSRTVPLMALLFIRLSGAAVAAPPVYTVEDLSPLPGTVEARGNAVNAGGAVVGQAKAIGSFFQAVLWPSGSGVPTDIAGLIGESASVANGINDAGHFTAIAGFATPGQSVGGTAHFWNGATLVDIGKLAAGTPQSMVSSLGNAVNNLDQVVGRAWASAADTGNFHAFSWQGGVLTDLGTFGTCGDSEALDVNDNGQIVGSGSAGCLPNLALVWPSAGAAAMSINGILAAAGITENVTRATGINDAGVVLAQRTLSSKGRCVVFTPGPLPSLVDIGYLGVDAQFLTTCQPGKINNYGDVVATQSGATSIPLLYADGVLYDLNTLLDASSAVTWQLVSATDINDAGTIVGEGRINGELHAYRAVRVGGERTPTPTATPLPCVGDCNSDGTVAVNELVVGVNVALGNAAVNGCPSFDASGDATVSINELIAAVNALLSGCAG